MMYFNELHCNETSALDGLYQDQEPKQRLKVSPGGHFFLCYQELKPVNHGVKIARRPANKKLARPMILKPSATPAYSSSVCVQQNILSTAP